MRKFDTSNMPTENANLWNLIMQETMGNVKAFAEKIGVSQQMVDPLLRRDKVTGEYKRIYPMVRKAIKETFNVDDMWFCTPLIEKPKETTQALDNDYKNMMSKLIDQITILAEANDRNSKSIEKLLNIIIKEKNE